MEEDAEGAEEEVEGAAEEEVGTKDLGAEVDVDPEVAKMKMGSVSGLAHERTDEGEREESSSSPIPKKSIKTGAFFSATTLFNFQSNGFTTFISSFFVSTAPAVPGFLEKSIATGSSSSSSPSRSNANVSILPSSPTSRGFNTTGLGIAFP